MIYIQQVDNYRDLAQENRAAAFSGLTWIIGSVCAAFICFFLFFHYFVEHNQEAKSGMVEVMDFAVSRGAMNRFVLDAIDGVYYGGFSSAEEAASMNGHECRLNIYSEIARAILQ